MHHPDTDHADTKKTLAAALGRIPSGLFVLTATKGDAEASMLGSWVQQCSFDPPQITIALGRGRDLLGWLVEGAGLVVNVLGEGQKQLVGHFGKGFAAGEPAFEGIAVEREEGRAPVLAEALAFLDCRVTARYPAGDHELIVARVVGGRVLREGRPAVHVRRSGLHY